METANPTSSIDSAKEMSISPPTNPSRSHSSSSITRMNSHGHSHRHSLAENLRGLPPSPRSQRHPSLTQAAIQDLLNHPPTSKAHNPRFAGRDWRDVAVGELASKDDVKWVTMDTSVEEATMVLLKNTASNVVLIKENAESTTPISTFDCNDLNAYLLVVVGLGNPTEELVPLFDTLAKKAQAHEDIPLRDIQPICRKESLVMMHGDANLAKVIEVFGSGIHQFLVTNNAGEVIGILSQLTLVEFFWNEGVNFRAIDELYPLILKDLGVGSQQIVAIGADSPLADALTLMNNEGLSSVAVVDNKSNVVGNISTIDVRLLTNAASLPLLQNTCMHFVSVILNERGMEQGKDSFPVFYVNPYSTLAHTVAKLVATKSHRMWVVESASPSPSAPATPLLGPQVLVPESSRNNSVSAIGTQTHFTSVPSTSLSGPNSLSGRLTGVVTLTDILNLFARTSGLNPTDPSEQRARRRRSSSSSIRPSLDASRSSIDLRR
ncbi:sds23/moc1 [Apiospora rasikravindrae]|uniref:Protein SDS23 n=1 Tax=Apiospora rasikravindrae TaxID=990691 RepID=A0ABR1RX42_9PEZI